MAMTYWDDVEIGDSLPPMDVHISKEQVRAYARAADLSGARFTDDEGARREGLPGIITPGNMTMGLLQRRITDWDDDVVLRRLSVVFRGLVLPDQTLRLHGNVVGKDEDGGDHTAELDLWVETEAGERAVTGTATVALPRRPK